MKINLIELFEETADKYPHKIAVIDKDRDITFCGLRDKAMTLAQKIINGGIGQNKPVAVFLDKSIESVFANLGIIYSGNFYMNLDIKTPAERISNILHLLHSSTMSACIIREINLRPFGNYPITGIPRT